MGTRHPSIVPYECFQTKDGFAIIGVANEKQWVSLCGALGLENLASDSRFDSMAARIAHYDELKPVLEKVLFSMTRAEVLALL